VLESAGPCSEAPTSSLAAGSCSSEFTVFSGMSPFTPTNSNNLSRGRTCVRESCHSCVTLRVICGKTSCDEQAQTSILSGFNFLLYESRTQLTHGLRRHFVPFPLATDPRTKLSTKISVTSEHCYKFPPKHGKLFPGLISRRRVHCPASGLYGWGRKGCGSFDRYAC
jgi:hypothetical protein